MAIRGKRVELAEGEEAPGPRASFFRGLWALVVPRRSPESLVEAKPAQRLESAARPTPLRRTLLLSLVTMGSAVLVAYLFRLTNVTPMLPRTVLSIGSIVCLSAATIGILGWRRRLHPRILYVLYWIGICWGALAILWR